jgi:aspartyl-tRNA(Asn)/glutamyl-tRNA(Gln) amidotransferase subunit A
MPQNPLTIAEAAAALRAGTTTSVELVRRGFAVADEFDRALGVYLDRYDDAALHAAAQADTELAAGGDRGPLHGIPIAVKDIIACREGPTTAQSVVHDPMWWAGQDAPVVARLRAAGAVITGKLTLSEYACGMPDPTKPFPAPANPWDTGAWAGGSSAGSGSGVAAGFVLGALGTDTGGSVRVPAAFCGVTGLKPTFGIVSKSGCHPLGTTLDHIGPLARTAWDCAAMLSAMVGSDATDPNMRLEVEPADYTSQLTGDLGGVTIGVARVHRQPGVRTDATLEAVFDAALTVMADTGAALVEVTLPYLAETQTATLTTLHTEAFAYHRSNLVRRPLDYGRSARGILMGGALLTATDYAAAQRTRRVASTALDELFRQVDLIVTPTCGCGALPLEGISGEQLANTMFTPYWNGLGCPALSVPMGFTATGLPLGLQIAGRPTGDALVLRAGDAYQRQTDFHRRTPPLNATAVGG